RTTRRLRRDLHGRRRPGLRPRRREVITNQTVRQASTPRPQSRTTSLPLLDPRPHLAEQTEQAWCLTVLTNSVVTWTTEYYTLAVKQLRAEGRSVPDELLAHISPGHSDNINFFGVINVDIEAELAKLTGGWRPLRPAHFRDLGLRPTLRLGADLSGLNAALTCRFREQPAGPT